VAGPPPKTTPAHPRLTVPQLLGFGAFGVFVILAIVSSNRDDAVVLPDELVEIRKLTVFLIGALLPSDALIRFGRNLLFQTVDDADTAASHTPATTVAQMLAFAVFALVVALTLISNGRVSKDEFDQVNEVARVLIVALLPSDAGIRFGRALYYRSDKTPAPTMSQLGRV
jgi:hypothetical protein